MTSSECLERVYQSWRVKRLHCACLNLSQLDNPSEEEKARLEIVKTTLAGKPFGKRLDFYRNLKQKEQNYAEADNFEYAITLRDMAEDFKIHFLD